MALKISKWPLKNDGGGQWWPSEILTWVQHCIMVTAVEHDNQTRQFITSQIMIKNDIKMKFKIWDDFHFSDIHQSMNTMGPVQSKRTPFVCHFLCTRPIAFILWWMSGKWNLYLKWTWTISEKWQHATLCVFAKKINISYIQNMAL